MDTDGFLEDDIQELQLERSIASIALNASRLKSNEELEKLTVNENLSDIERAVYLLSSGQDVQRLSVITNLPHLLKENNYDCLRRVVPKVREVLHVAQSEMQLAASSAFLEILEKDLVPPQNYTQSFLPTILKLAENRDPELAMTWLDTLIDVLDLLPKDVIKRDVLNLAVSKGQLSQSMQSRLACCRIIGKIATKFEPFVIRKEILPLVQSLCQDIEFEVRASMCRQLGAVAKGLGLEETKSAILPELVELANDEELPVRLAGIDTVVEIIQYLDSETRKSTLVPLVCKFCEQAVEGEEITLPVIAKHVGQICHGLEDNFSDEEKLWLLEFFRQLCKLGLAEKVTKPEQNSTSKVPVIPEILDTDGRCVECRKHAAFNFPAIVLFCSSKSFRTELYPVFSSLCHDPNILVRKTVSSGFHEVCKMVGNTVHLLHQDLISLLKEDNMEILRAIVPNVSDILQQFVKGGGDTPSESKMNSMGDLIPALLSCDATISVTNDWRLHAQLLSGWECLPKCFLSQHIYDKFVPLLFRRLKTARPLPVKLAAAQTLLVIIRYNRKSEQRQEMICRIIEEYCHSKSCHNRSLFIDISRMVLQLYSKAFFKDNFFEFLLSLSTDQVPNVRYRLCSVLPSLKTLIRLPGDRTLLQQLESCVRRLLINERDRDVTSAIKQAVDDLDRTTVQMDSLRKQYYEEDLIDQKRQEEEELLIDMEEKELKEEKEKEKGKKKKEAGVSKIPAPRRTKPPAATKRTTAVTLDQSSISDKLSSHKDSNQLLSDKHTKSGSTDSVTKTSNKSQGPKSLRSLRNAPQNSPKAINRISPGISSAGSSSSRKGSASSTTSFSSISSGSSGVSSPVNSAGQRRSPASSQTESPNGKRNVSLRKGSIPTMSSSQLPHILKKRSS